MAEENNRISISRDALRADLAEMELRLRTWIGSQLESKADIKTVTNLMDQVAELRQNVVFREGPLMQEFKQFERIQQNLAEGNFTEAQKRSLQIMMDDNLKEHTDVGWTNRQRWIAVAALLVSIASVLTALLVATHYVGH